MYSFKATAYGVMLCFRRSVSALHYSCLVFLIGRMFYLFFYAIDWLVVTCRCAVTSVGVFDNRLVLSFAWITSFLKWLGVVLREELNSCPVMLSNCCKMGANCVSSTSWPSTHLVIVLGWQMTAESGVQLLLPVPGRIESYVSLFQIWLWRRLWFLLSSTVTDSL